MKIRIIGHRLGIYVLDLNKVDNFIIQPYQPASSIVREVLKIGKHYVLISWGSKSTWGSGWTKLPNEIKPKSIKLFR